jgi:hypothetical protein
MTSPATPGVALSTHKGIDTAATTLSKIRTALATASAWYRRPCGTRALTCMIRPYSVACLPGTTNVSEAYRTISAWGA